MKTSSQFTFNKYLVQYFLTSSTLLLFPKEAQIFSKLIETAYKNTVFLNESLFCLFLKLIFGFLVQSTIRRQKVLFIFEKENFSFFQQLFERSDHHIACCGIFEAEEFLKQFMVKHSVCSLVFVGEFSNFSLKNFERYRLPIIFFSPVSRWNFDYFLYSRLDYAESLVFLRILIRTLLVMKPEKKEQKNLKKTVQEGKFFSKKKGMKNPHKKGLVK